MSDRFLDTRPARFAAVGLIATVIDLGTAVALAEAGWPRWAADVPALVLAGAVSLLLHRRVTLRGDPAHRWIQRRWVFPAVAGLAGLVDIAVFVSLTGLSSLAAKLIAIVVAALVRAVAHRGILFRAVRREQGRPAHRPPPAGDRRLSVVVPAYRESDRIGDTVVRLRTELEAGLGAGQVEIVVVDDGSDDGTAAAAEGAGADVVVALDPNRGKGGAVRSGVSRATARTVAFTDADLAYPPHQLVRLVEEVEGGWDVVIGNRQHADTRTVVGASTVRSLGSRAVNAVSHLLLLGQYRDTQCGIKAFRADVAAVIFPTGQVDGFAFDIELLHFVEVLGLSLREVPVEVVNTETSTVRAVRDGVAVLADVLRIRRRSRLGRYDLDDRSLPVAGSRTEVADGG